MENTNWERKKPATSSSDENEQTPSSGAAAVVPEIVWLRIASFATPPDVYNLALSSKQFFVVSSSVPDTNNNTNTNNATTTSATVATAAFATAAVATNQKQQMDKQEDPPLVATRMLRRSLLSSLARVLKNSDSGLTLDSMLDLAELPGGTTAAGSSSEVIIAGSAMVQACLGVIWDESDVDVFCSCQVAPAVRTWLVDNAGSMFVGWKDSYSELCDGRFLYTVDTKIHHVEKYGSLEKNATRAGFRLDRYIDTTTEWGKNCQENYVRWKWQVDPEYGILGIDVQDRDFNIKPMAGGEFPFDFDGFGNIDLVIAKKKQKSAPSKSNTKKPLKKAKIDDIEFTPFDILDDFDLNICKASFDGKKFRIPEPHQTFTGKTTMEYIRKIIVQSYVHHFNQHPENSRHRLDSIEKAHLARDIVSAVKSELKMDSSNCSFFKLVDWADTQPDIYQDAGDPTFLYSPDVQAKYGAYLQFHNWTSKLVHRLRKYKKRGIEVVDGPVIIIQPADTENFPFLYLLA